MATPIKTYRFGEDVLEVLKSGVVWSAEGTHAVIPAKLERRLYDKVSKAFELMGGKWSRAIQAHVFITDPRPHVEGLVNGNGTLTVEVTDFFETPDLVLDRMVAVAEGFGGFGGWILEPSAGKGAIVRRIIAECDKHGKHYEITAVEKSNIRAFAMRELFKGNPRVSILQEDFLDNMYSRQFKFVVMNPPFTGKQYIDHILAAWKFIVPGGFLIAVAWPGFETGSTKKEKEFAAWVKENDLTVLPLPEKAFRESGTNVKTVLIFGVKPHGED